MCTALAQAIEDERDTEEFCVYYADLMPDQCKVDHSLSFHLLFTDRVAFQKYDDEAARLVCLLLP